MTDQPSTTLQAALERREIALPAEQVAQLDRYCQALWQWNENLNLTRHTDFDKFVDRDVVDSCALAALLEPDEEVLDVGTGGGVPGVVVAILRPDLQVSLCDSTAKKAKAVDNIVDGLQLPIPVHNARAEDLLDDFRFHTLMARAVGPMKKMLRWFEPHWDSIGRLLLVKGPRWVEERGEARQLGLLEKLELRRLSSYTMPETGAESVVVQVRPTSEM